MIPATQNLPPAWVWVCLKDLAELKGGITKGHKRKPTQSLRPVPYLRVANVQRGFLHLGEVREIDATEEEVAELRLEEGDVLFNEGGDRDKLGRGWIWRGELPECIHQNHVFRARIRAGVADPKYISWYGNSAGQAYFIAEGKQTTNLASLNLTKLGQLPVKLPPLAEQRRIVAAIEEQFTRLDAAVASLERACANLKRYRRSVLNAIVEGRVRVEARDFGMDPPGSGTPLASNRFSRNVASVGPLLAESIGPILNPLRSQSTRSQAFLRIGKSRVWIL